MAYFTSHQIKAPIRLKMKEAVKNTPISRMASRSEMSIPLSLHGRIRRRLPSYRKAFGAAVLVVFVIAVEGETGFAMQMEPELRDCRLMTVNGGADAHAVGLSLPKLAKNRGERHSKLITSIEPSLLFHLLLHASTSVQVNANGNGGGNDDADSRNGSDNQGKILWVYVIHFVALSVSGPSIRLETMRRI
jgi:hypothetical protein